ncbi:MAG: 3-methyl-2-oxobutanoate hydroxymethyltransferase [Candidatus Dadabacteria bacterium]|nr:MAG: 3-methyl-2-oxobutanoate hydroxymethyltransferase [Candidatus Dadabacteria bacterium]
MKAQNKKVTVPLLQKWKRKGRKIVALTAYDFATASILDNNGIDLILVGDSLGVVFQGNETTIPVTLDEVIYHSRCVSRGVKRALVVGDMPFLSYQVSPAKAIESAGRLIKEGGVSAVKVEGGIHIAEIVSRITEVDIPVMGHVGLTPQSYHRMGGNKVQGREHGSSKGQYERIVEDALAVEAAGAFAVVVEGVPPSLGREITSALSVPTIGIGAGPFCDGQILVSHDAFGLFEGFKPRFVKAYANLGEIIARCAREFASEVSEGVFPAEEHCYDEPEAAMDNRRAVTLKLARKK